MRYLTVRKFSSESGYTEAAIRSKIADGTWIEDRVWRRAPDKRILIDVEGFASWVETPQVSRIKGQPLFRAVSYMARQPSLSPPPFQCGTSDETPVYEDLWDKVLEKRLAELVGTTQKALEHQRLSGLIPANVWQKIGGRILYSRSRYDEWLEGKWSASEKTIFKSSRNLTAATKNRVIDKLT
jgi:hypothetical protein